MFFPFCYLMNILIYKHLRKNYEISLLLLPEKKAIWNKLFLKWWPNLLVVSIFHFRTSNTLIFTLKCIYHFFVKCFCAANFFSKLCFYFGAEKRGDVKTEALLKMVAPGAGFRGGTLFRTKNGCRPKKKGLRWDFRSKSMWRPKK